MRLAAVPFGLSVVLVLAPASAGAGTTRTPVSLVASPARVTITASGRATVEVTNSGSRRVELNVRRAGFAIDLRGRPRIIRGSGVARVATSWLTVRPRRLAIPPGKKASLTISSRVPRRAQPGDHNALVLLTSLPLRGARVAVRVRLGVVVVVRAPGRISRGLALRRLTVRRTGASRRLELLVANRGNVTEVVARNRSTIVLRRGQRVVARLQPAARELLPRSNGLLQARYTGRVRGRVTALVELSAEPGRRAVQRIFHIRI